jgi:hypothetical protein
MCLGAFACQTDDPNNPGVNLEGSLEDILESIYNNADVDESFKEFIAEGLYTTPITQDRVGYFLGKDDIEFEQAIASEPVMSTSAYSLCLVRVRQGADIEQIKRDIKDNVDPMKWICVGVDPGNIVVDNIGDVVFLLMTNYEKDALHNAFLSLQD